MDKEEIKNDKISPKKKEESVLEMDIGIDADENVNSSNINISKYTFLSNDNSKNLLLNSMSFRRIDIISSVKMNINKGKGLSRNFELNGLSNSTGLIPNTQRTGKFFSNK